MDFKPGSASHILGILGGYQNVSQKLVLRSRILPEDKQLEIIFNNPVSPICQILIKYKGVDPESRQFLFDIIGYALPRNKKLTSLITNSQLNLMTLTVKANTLKVEAKDLLKAVEQMTGLSLH